MARSCLHSDKLHPIISEQVLDGVVTNYIQIILHELCNILPAERDTWSHCKPEMSDTQWAL